MSKVKLLSFLVIALVILNITLMVVFVFNKPHHPHHPNLGKEPKHIIIERLHFDEEQIKAYDELIQKHQTKIRAFDKELRDTKEELYLLLNENDSSKTETYFTKITTAQKEIEKLHFQHFLDIKKLCNNNQLKDYNELTLELTRLFSPPRLPKK